MELNFAQEFLLGLQKDDPVYIKHKKTCDKVIQEFTKLCESEELKRSTKVMAHYWNPTHYLHNGDIVPPVELLDPAFVKFNDLQTYGEYSIESIDELYL